MKATELIARSVYLSGIGARDLDPVSSTQGKDGLFFLNQLLEEKADNGNFIPYYSHITVPTVIGQEEYFIEDLVTLDAITFTYQSVRYKLINDNRRYYWGSPRANGIESLPLRYYYERSNGGMSVFLYFLPDRVYELQLTGKLALQPVTYDTDLDTVFDRFYQSFLMYELSEKLCEFYLITLNPQIQNKLAKLRAKIRNLNYLDLTMQKISTLNKKASLNYADVNIGKGWTA